MHPTHGFFIFLLQLHSFDLDLLENCDDAYWENFEHPEQISKQPPEKPSEIAFFICLVELNQMIVSALRNIVGLLPRCAAETHVILPCPVFCQ